MTTIATAAGLFAATNVDDVVVLAALNATSRVQGRPKAWQIWIGQYVGVAVLVGVSMLAALGLARIPVHLDRVVGPGATGTRCRWTRDRYPGPRRGRTGTGSDGWRVAGGDHAHRRYRG